MPDDPILTPQHTLTLRGVDLGATRFDLAVFCFRGVRASNLLVEALAVSRVEQPRLYGRRCCSGTIAGLHLVVLPFVVWGGPVTAILLEELACLGVHTAIGFGAAGSLVSAAHIGRMLLAERAAACDGTSREYTDEAWVAPDLELLALADQLATEEGVSPLRGAVWTTDALYQERPSRVSRWREEGADVVNLETGPFYAVSAALGIRAVYLGLVTDYVSQEQGWQHDLWGRDNAMEPDIIRVVRRLVDAVAAQSEGGD
jgi:uridine phosphorylase